VNRRFDHVDYGKRRRYAVCTMLAFSVPLYSVFQAGYSGQRVCLVPSGNALASRRSGVKKPSANRA
jgi:hypothetical protein